MPLVPVCIEWRIAADGQPYDVRGAAVALVGTNQYRVTSRRARHAYVTGIMFFPAASDGVLSAVNNYGVYTQAPDAGSAVKISLALDHPDGIG